MIKGVAVCDRCSVRHTSVIVAEWNGNNSIRRICNHLDAIKLQYDLIATYELIEMPKVKTQKIKRQKRQLASAVALYKGRYPKKSEKRYWAQSAYYWWWQFLKRNDEYLKCCEKEGKGKLARLYADFGDVRGDDFWEWWSYRENKGDMARGEILFRERSSTQFKQLGSKEDWDDSFDDKSQYVVLAINIKQPRRAQQRRVSDALRQAIADNGVARKKGRMSLGLLEESTARYPIHQNFTPTNLSACLACYDAWLLWKDEDPKARAPQWMVAEYINAFVTTLSESEIAEEGRKFLVANQKQKSNEGLFGSTGRKGSQGYNSEYRNLMTSLFGRYVREAKAMIANTSKGQFPNKVLQK